MFKKVLIIVIAIVAVFALAMKFLFIEVYVSANDVPTGTVVESGDLLKKTYLFTDVPASAYKNEVDIVGKVATIDIQANSFFMSYTIKTVEGSNGSVLPDGAAIVSLVIHQENAPLSLSIGDSVKVIAYFSAGQAVTKPAFAVTFPYNAKIWGIKKDAAGGLVGVDIVVDHPEISTELTIASLQGTIALVKTSVEPQPEVEGTTVDEIYNKYYSGSSQY